MPWRPGRNGTICRNCGRHITECGELSARGKCELCRLGRMVVNIQELRDHSGPFFHHWRKQMAASVGGVLVDD